jgi:beta-glucosidase
MAQNRFTRKCLFFFFRRRIRFSLDRERRVIEIVIDVRQSYRNIFSKGVKNISMKRNIRKIGSSLVVIAIVLLFTEFGTAQQEGAVQDITQAPFPVLFVKTPNITIDAETDDWPDLLPCILESDSQLALGRRDQASYFSGKILAFFDEKNFYVAATLRDTTPFLNRRKGTDIWQGDSLEIYLGFHDGMRNSMDEGDFQLGISLLPENQTVWNWPLGKAVEHYELAVQPTKEGCMLEARIALDNFRNIAAQPGNTVWMDFGINNATKLGGERTGQLMWHGDADNYRSPALWQKVSITENPADLDPLIITGPALLRVKSPYHAQIFYQKHPWQGAVQINGENRETDEQGGVDFTLQEETTAVLALEIDGKKLEKRLFASRRLLRKYVQGASGQKKELPPIPENVPYKNAQVPISQRVDDLLSYMTLEEKIGQMTQIERGYIEDSEDIPEFGLGSLLSGGGSTPERNVPEEWVNMYNTYQQAALQSRLGIPLMYGIDAVHGHNNVRGATIFPHNIGLGATRDPDLVERAARVTAIEVSATGVDWTFSPCIAVPRDERWGRTYEGFSENPELTGILGAAAIRGYQGNDLADPTTILATAKHYAGDGGTTGGKDQGNTELPEAEFRAIHLRPYQDAIAANVGSIMVSFSSWNGEKIHGSRYLLTDVLKQEMQFKGFVVSDWGAVKQLPGSPREQIQAAVNAGIDMVMVPDDYMQFTTVLTSLVQEGSISEARIDDAVRKILTIKFQLGLFEKPFADNSLLNEIGSAEHRAVAREAVRKSLVLLKNNGILPLSKNTDHIHVAGKMSKDIGSQCGGWTITWQGQTGTITEGTTIYQAIVNSVSPETKVSYSRNGSGAKDAHVVFVVVGEEPYAEFQGDSATLALSPADKNTIAKAKQFGVPVVIILISGRPLIITEELEQADAFMAAWLPGTEGEGVADVLFGDYAPTGKLPYTWPKSIDQVPINPGDGKESPLFPYGFGLSY